MKIDYEAVHNGFDITNKKEVWDTFLHYLPAMSKSLLLEELGDKRDSVLNLVEPMGQLIQFTSPIIQIHNIEFDKENPTFWSGYLHGENYQLNNMLIPCEFELTYIGNDNFKLETTIDVLTLKHSLLNKGLSNQLKGITTAQWVSSTSIINGENIDMFTWNCPKLFPSNYGLRWVYLRLDYL